MSIGMHLVLSLLLLPLAAGAASRPSVHVPGKAVAAREAPRDMRKQKPKPMHTPAPTNQYANPPAIPHAWKI